MAKHEDYLKQNDDGSVDVTLSRPLTIDGAQVSVVRLREPTVDDLLAGEEIKGSAANREVQIFANLAEISTGDIRRLPARDYNRMQRAYGLFID